MGVSADVDVSGPLFTGSLGRAIARGCEEARQNVGEMGVEMVRARFDTVLRHDAPAYRTGKRVPGTLRAAVQVAHEGDLVRVHNGDVIYRAWIEGTGSRNRSTRFKGYRTFRKVGQLLRLRAVVEVRRQVADAVRRAS